VGLSASRSVGISKWIVLICRPGFGTISRIPDPTLSLRHRNTIVRPLRAAGGAGSGWSYSKEEHISPGDMSSKGFDYLVSGEAAVAVGSIRYYSPRHRMPFYSMNQASKMRVDEVAGYI